MRCRACARAACRVWLKLGVPLVKVEVLMSVSDMPKNSCHWL